jgi:prepilin-type N-terminal cleavage/methylation domain-containing protein
LFFQARAASRGFTLIEMMAVVAIIGLMLGVLLPNLSATQASQLERQGKDLAARIDLARERAIVTSAPHRVWFEVEEGAFRVDWWVDESRAFAIPGEEDDDTGRVEAPFQDMPEPISLSPPQTEEREYFPVPMKFGTDSWLEDDTFFEGINTQDGWITEGEVQLVFQIDGSTDYAEVFLEDEWGNSVTVEVQPLLDHARVYRTEED